MSLFLRQLHVGPMKNFVYLVGPEESTKVLVIDPAWDVAAIERQLAEDRKELAGIFVSHHHGDHTNGVEELLTRHDVPLYVQRTEADFSSMLRGFGSALRLLGAGDPIDVGGRTFKALLTPGHTPGSQCLWAGDALVSGDTLFVDHCGRCDLPGGDPEAMYRSLSSVLLELPASTRLLPGHDYGDVPVSSLERERQRNPYLLQSSVADFVKLRMRPRG
jgi:glyoxylase-like metal-dependent hydrolase (beta-lactamase superfamily II)